MKQFLTLIILVLLVAGCGKSRESEFVAEEVEEPATAADSDAESSDTESSDEESSDEESSDEELPDDGAALPTTSLPELTPDTTGVASETAMSATVGNSTWEITHGELDQIVGPTIGDDEFAQIIFGGEPAVGFAASVLTQLYVSEVVAAELAAEGSEVDQASLDSSKEVLAAELEGMLDGSPDAAATVEGFFNEEPYLEFLVEFQARQESLSVVLAVDGEPKFPCARHILVETVDEANGILDELDADGDFGDIARERSLDPGSGAQGGDLGCADPANFVPEFKAAIESAEIGEVVGPVETEFGAHIIIVDRFEADGRQLATELLQERLSTAEITVDPAIGVWSEETLAIVPGP